MTAPAAIVSKIEVARWSELEDEQPLHALVGVVPSASAGASVIA
jgi:hypothetical protein